MLGLDYRIALKYIQNPSYTLRFEHIPTLFIWSQ